MKFEELPIAGAWLVDPEPIIDERGFFARSWCADEFSVRGMNRQLVQCNISFNRYQGTLRGMHFQRAPASEAKLIRCTSGAIFDVVLDLRIDSSTFRQWTAVELSAQNHRQLYLAEGLAHGFQTLADNTEVFYQMSTVFNAAAATGVRWDDPAFGIRWPDASHRIISAKDQSWPRFCEASA